METALIMSNAALPNGEALGLEVPLGSIERSLQQIWADDQAKTRSSLINFAIYSEEAGDLGRHCADLEAITAQHSCRALLVVNLAAETAPARAWISAHCRPYQEGKVVCSEQISFVLQGADAAQVQNVVFGHLDSDLPLMVWWQGSLKRCFEERLYSRIHTLIVDSSRWIDPAAQLQRLLGAWRSADFDVRDLSWTRSHLLRTALAVAFQDGKALEHLHELQHIEIVHGQGHRSAALLLAAWLGWRLKGGKPQPAAAAPQDGDASLQWISPQGGTVTVAIKAAAPAADQAAHSCALLSLELSGGGMSVRIWRQSCSSFIHIRVCAGEHQHEEVMPADSVSDAGLVGAQLERAGGSTHFREVLALLPHWLEATGSH